MHKIIETIKTAGIPIHSQVAAAQHMGANRWGTQDYEDTLKKASGKEVSFANDDIARITFSYFVVEAIKASEHTDVLNADTLMETAVEKANEMLNNDPWMFAKSETEERLDDDGKPKPKKGAKKDLAKKVYNEKIKDKVTKRKDAIAILVEEVGLTPAGASTYYANLKKGTL